MLSIITSNNKTIVNKNETLRKRKCNRINENKYPLNGERQAEDIFYDSVYTQII